MASAIDIKILPLFGCAFPNIDNYMFALVLQTAMPLSTQQAPGPLHALARPCADPALQLAHSRTLPESSS
eukprot:5242646-Prymnesium_polylepis.1